MKKRVVRIIGFVFLVFGIILLLNSFSGITGYVIFKDVGKGVGSILGLVFVIGGLVLLMAEREGAESGLVKKTRKIKEELRKVLDSRHVGTYKELSRMANNAGYTIKNKKRHEEVYLPSGKPLLGRDGHPVTIPRGKHVDRNTYKSILRAIYEGV